MKHPGGTIVNARPRLEGRHMRVVASVRMDSGEEVEAQLPDRETAAILPRSILAGASAAPVSLLDTLGTIAARMCDGRRARVWSYKERRFFSFQSWKSVRFVEDGPPCPDAREAAPAASPAQPGGAVLPAAVTEPRASGG